MTQVVIENPILNSPFGEPTRHFKFTDEGISNDVAKGGRIHGSDDLLNLIVEVTGGKEKRQGSQSRHGSNAMGAGDQQPWWAWALGVC